MISLRYLMEVDSLMGKSTKLISQGACLHFYKGIFCKLRMSDDSGAFRGFHYWVIKTLRVEVVEHKNRDIDEKPKTQITVAHCFERFLSTHY